MAKRLSVSSQREELVSMTSEDIRNRKWTEAEKQAIRRAAAKQAAGDDSDIDYSDIPRLTAKQLAEMVRLRDVRRKQAVSVRLDPEVLDWLQVEGRGAPDAHQRYPGEPDGSGAEERKESF